MKEIRLTGWIKPALAGFTTKVRKYFNNNTCVKLKDPKDEWFNELDEENINVVKYIKGSYFKEKYAIEPNMPKVNLVFGNSFFNWAFATIEQHDRITDAVILNEKSFSKIINHGDEAVFYDSGSEVVHGEEIRAELWTANIFICNSIEDDAVLLVSIGHKSRIYQDTMVKKFSLNAELNGQTGV